MGLRFIYGRSGSGKSTYCINEIKSKLDAGVQYPLILLVPEQYSLQAEKNIASATGKGGTIGCEVLTFRRMAYRVFNEVGGLTKKRLNTAGKSMLIFRVLQNLKQELKILSNSATRKGFVKVVSDLITEFKRHNVTPKDFEKVLNDLPDKGTIKQKLTEIYRIYNEFDNYVHQNYMDLDDDLTFLYQKIDDSIQFNNAEIWIDEFSGFTPQEFNVIEKLMHKAKDIHICMRTDCLTGDGTDPCDLFAPIIKTVERLVNIANANRIDIKRPTQLSQKPLPRFVESQELAHLESALFTYPAISYDEATKDIEVFVSNGIRTEIESAARKIIDLCREKEYRFKDIAVITGNLETYEKSIRNIFSMYEIPFFIDSKRSIADHPLVSFILSAIDIYIKNWSYETVFRYLKTGLTNLEQQEIDLIENYVLACGIRGNLWTKNIDWEYLPENSGLEESDDPSTLTKINTIRKKTIEPLVNFINQIKGRRTAREICTALYNLLNDTRACEKTEKYIEYFKNTGQLELANEYSQIWNILMEVFDQIVEVLGDTKLSLSNFRDVLDTGLSEHKIGLVPPSLDQVQVGSTERSINHNIKALFVLGVNDGSFPTTIKDEGIISDSERNMLSNVGLELAKDCRTRTFEENYFVYEVLTTPSRFLWLSYPVSDSEGRTMRPSGVIVMLKRIFPHLTEKSNVIENNSTEDNFELLSMPTPTFNELLKKIKLLADGSDIGGFWKDVAVWYINNKEWANKFKRALSGLNYTNTVENLNPDSIKKVIGNTMYTSISRLESFVNCPFAYFVQYGLRAKERKVFKLTPLDVGTFMHNIIDIFSKAIVSQKLSWRKLTKEVCNSMVSEVVDAELKKAMGNILNSSKRYFYLTNRLKRIMSRAVWVIAEHIRRSGFEPLDYEVSFGPGYKIPPIVLELSNGETVKLTGRIDRVDVFQTEDGVYFRIIDYKSGSKDFSLQDVYYGLQLQLITYLDAIENMKLGNKQPLLAGGMLYFKIDDPIIRSKGDMSSEEVEKAIMKQLKMNGLLLADVKLIKEMDREISGNSDIIPVRLNKGDVIAKSSSVATSEQLLKLRKYARMTLQKISQEIVNGNIAIKPWKNKLNISCRYCRFTSICRFDSSLPNNNYRILHDIENEVIWERIKGE